MAEMVGGALLSTFFESLFDRIASVEIIDFFQGKKELKLLEKLKTRLLSVNAVLDDAEIKQLRNPSVKRWLDELKDVAEDAENLLDEISTDALEAKILGAESGTSGKKRKFSSLVSASTNFLFGRDTKAELECFASQKDILGLTNVVGERVSRRLPSTSLVEDSKLYGRKEDKNVVKKLVLSDGDETVSVIPIVGMGGVGKTTLAQALINDDEVKKDFEVKAWVCVSEDFDVCNMTKKLLEAVTNSACETMELNMLQVRLKEKLNQKKFLVVLDDVWNENYDNWNVLRRPFQDGAKGSKIIVTTRNEKVALVMGSSPIHHLKELSNDDCWELFAKHASGNGDFMKYAKLEAIGREIAMKCKGLPLAAKTLGGLLRSTFDVEAWERVLRSDIWDFTDDESNILPALRVSYHYLPSHLKRCFAHCSMFPKSYKFEKEELVSLWMAENLVGHSKINKRMEDVGDEYFNDLVSRSLFQRSQSSSKKSWFLMHDLIVDMAKFVSGNSFQLKGVDSASESATKLRHLAYYARTCDSYKQFNHAIEATRLRTFLPLCVYGYNKISDRVVVDLLLKLKCLRFLSFRGYKSIRKLPDTIGELKHLRYLDLTMTSISELPESVCGLYNLQTLDLSKCDCIKSLPRYMHRLINLRRLRISEQCIEMPTQISKLKNLQTLNIFIVGKHGETRLCELRELSDIRGSLCVKKLSNVVDPKDASEAKLIDEKHLEVLSLAWDSDDTNDTAHAKLVLENLAPSTSLQILQINNYWGTSFPNWVGGHAYDSIVELKLSNCKYCTSLPPLGELASLKNLEICNFPAVKMVDHSFFGNSTCSTKSFPSLEELIFSYMSNWNEWKMEDDVAFPNLKKLRLHRCPKFIGNLPQLLPALTNLSIEDCRLIDCSLPATMPVVQTLKLVDCGYVVLQELPMTIKSLEIEGCGNELVSLSETLMKMETRLKQLKIKDCPSLITLGILSASLKDLHIENCAKLEFPFANSHGSFYCLRIQNSCDSIQYFPLTSFTDLFSLVICNSKNLESMSVCDRDMSSLSRLCIESCPKLVSFPAGGFSAPKLAALEIRNCKKLKCLPEQMHTLFPALQKLSIVECPELESFPEAGLPSNLRTIAIRNCDKLIASRTSWNLTRLTKLELF